MNKSILKRSILLALFIEALAIVSVFYLFPNAPAPVYVFLGVMATAVAIGAGYCAYMTEKEAH